MEVNGFCTPRLLTRPRISMAARECVFFMLKNNHFAVIKSIQLYVTTRVSQDVTECIDLIV
ncbi:hypothetical protein ALP99_102239 [Pseudomonas syringae pv. tomato]|uniref:Uncharacterized protein n=3 Tax=Pseudomonas syringae group TaxID=136849 RepID=A0A0P9VXT6_PSEYM|nr:hypothetical protein ALO86_101893 [Pseudomonas syringae pv. berberidis]KPX76161.1 hypothetical protein ALO84_101924 [Pseudomonas syringae pv. maculicola]KPY27769.1 hypothetical protein ALO54_102126 [Pseudomonas syringae pv. philadelphi]RMO89919.1 hypothetical protein ALQ32_101958 [Pseudomonas syringae pv. tagetis]RMQ65297.1 hypothetical protein ALQ00_102129 [Pseudomonas syringae pv. tomato]